MLGALCRVTTVDVCESPEVAIAAAVPKSKQDMNRSAFDPGSKSEMQTRA